MFVLLEVAHQRFVFTKFIGLQMFTSDEKSYEEEDAVVVHSISVMIVELSCQGQRLDLKQTWSSTPDLKESERSAGHVDKYYMGPGDQRCWSKKKLLQYINQMNRAAKMDQAKILFAQDPEERKGFQYDHVWPILKEVEKWLDNTPKENPKQGYDCFEGFQNESPVSASLAASSSIDLDANEETVAEVDHHVDSSGRPIGRKKEKLRRMEIADKSHLLESIVEGNQEIMINLKKMQKQREERFAKMENDSAARVQLMMLQAENESKRLKLQREHQEKEIMKMDLKSIADPIDREYFRRKKLEILEQNDQVANNSVSFSHRDFSSFRQYEGGDALPDY
ncbi:hypothetical protein LOK49_LG15G01388 [Camellia lanceoleosa]|uniref:Uncharacterized protein n=1 Tax=Camellia lanceoleosa TaxID=1840588 RepID=A0ACC0F4E9_9ERIC|nr:hypothetical protein LOK49_LG15G01388 [Camellia lanceoleosa]